MMTLDEARAHIGAHVTPHGGGTIENVTAQFVWVRYHGSLVAHPVPADTLTLNGAVDDPVEPVDGAS